MTLTATVPHSGCHRLRHVPQRHSGDRRFAAQQRRRHARQQSASCRPANHYGAFRWQQQFCRQFLGHGRSERRHLTRLFVRSSQSRFPRASPSPSSLRTSMETARSIWPSLTPASAFCSVMARAPLPPESTSTPAADPRKWSPPISTPMAKPISPLPTAPVMPSPSCSGWATERSRTP